MSMKYAYRVIDAFADRPFAGNSAAVVLLPSWPEKEWLQQVAMEMNLSETAYLVAQGNGYELRWFTPRIEVDLCGHATLAAALALAEEGAMPTDTTVEFATRSGILKVGRRGDSFELDFPVTPARPVDPPAGLREALGTEVVAISKSKFDYLVELPSDQAVRQLRPNFGQLAAVDCRGVIVTARSDDGQYDFVSRFFAPAAGIDEDPVTGSAHCTLVDYWSRRLGKLTLVGHQVSARGGVIRMELRGERVILAGRGYLFSQGTFNA